MWFGESESNVRDVFDKARQSAPCVLFFDELDSIGIKRGGGSGGGSEASDRVINQLLTEMDGIGIKKNVFVVGATNRPDILDDALLRPGRLDQLVYIPLPDKKSRINIIKAILKKTPIDPKIPMDFIADLTEGFSGADIKELANQVCKSAIKEAIEAEEQKKALMKDRPDEDIEMSEEPVAMITKRHFEVGLINARKSISDVDLSKYDDFKSKFDPSFNQNRGNTQSRIRWPDEGSSSSNVKAQKDDDLDLYS
jgi:transitional endoplasmic reticulum ATPase